MLAQRLNFTKEALERLPAAPAGTRRYYRDKGKKAVRGLVLQVTDKGTKTFQLYRWIAGRPERLTMKCFPDYTVEEARTKAAVYAGQIANGDSVEDIRESTRGELTLAAMFKDFLANKRNRRGERLAEKTKQNYRADFDRYAKRLAKRKLSEVRQGHVSRLHTKIGKQAPYAANRFVALLSSIYGYAAERKIFSGVNPAAGIKFFPEDSRQRTVKDDEMPYIWQAIADEPTDFRDVFLFALLTGARRGNVLSMKWKHIDLEGVEWDIPKVKSGGKLKVQLVEQAVEILKHRYPKEHDDSTSEFVFPGRGKKNKGHLVEVKGAWRRILRRAELLRLLKLIGDKYKWTTRERNNAYQEARADELAALKAWRAEARKQKLDVKRAKIDDLRIHDLRRSVGSAMAATGASIAITMQALGHKTVSASLIYQRLSAAPLRDALRKATGRILDQAGVSGALPVPIKRASA